MTIPGGTKSDYALFGNTWYFATNQPAKQSAPGASQAYAKMTYDLANRATGTYIGFAVNDGEKAWTIGDSDKIFEQTVLTLDDPGHVLQTAGYQRNQDATGTNVLTADNARVSYAAHGSTARAGPSPAPITARTASTRRRFFRRRRVPTVCLSA